MSREFDLCGGSKCCPKIKQVGDEYTITTDDGKSIILTRVQIWLLADRVLH